MDVATIPNAFGCVFLSVEFSVLRGSVLQQEIHHDTTAERYNSETARAHQHTTTLTSAQPHTVLRTRPVPEKDKGGNNNIDGIDRIESNQRNSSDTDRIKNRQQDTTALRTTSGGSKTGSKEQLGRHSGWALLIHLLVVCSSAVLPGLPVRPR